MSTFKALVATKGETGPNLAFTEFAESELMEGDVTVRVDAFDGELQGRPRAHRQGAGGAALADDPRHRLRRPGRNLRPSRFQAGRPRHPQWLGHGRDPSRRLCPEEPGQGRLAGAAARRHEPRRGDGDRHRRLHRDALRAGAGEAWPEARRGPGRRHRRGRRRRLGRDRAPGQGRLACPRLDRPGRGGRLSEEPRRRRDHRPQ